MEGSQPERDISREEKIRERASPSPRKGVASGVGAVEQSQQGALVFAYYFRGRYTCQRIERTSRTDLPWRCSLDSSKPERHLAARPQVTYTYSAHVLFAPLHSRFGL
jgi:hypothetical protein